MGKIFMLFYKNYGKTYSLLSPSLLKKERETSSLTLCHYRFKWNKNEDALKIVIQLYEAYSKISSR